MLRNKYILALLLVCVSRIITAQTLNYDSVKTAIISGNPELEMYRQQANAMDAMALGAKAWDAPQIGAGFFMTPYNPTYWQPRMMSIDGMNTMMPGMGNFMIQGRQMIPNPTRLNANKKYLSAVSSVETESGNATANNLLYEGKNFITKYKSLIEKYSSLLRQKKHWKR